jgi:membrane-bound lytic murein transglycosylase D
MVFKQLSLVALSLCCAVANASGPHQAPANLSLLSELAALESTALPTPVSSVYQSPCMACPLPPLRALVGDADRKALAGGDLWVRVREHLELSKTEHPRVSAALEQYRRSPYSLQRISARATPFLYYVLQQVQARDMPADIALLPILESGFRATAKSRAGARGLWQLMAGTAGRFGLKDSWWLEARLDIELSTAAALDYLDYLHQRFEGDWLLALAAYNAGEGRVSRAILSNREAGQPTDFWHLPLPAETRNYVPRLLAIARIISDPKPYGIELEPIVDKPYLGRVRLKHYIELETAARLAAIGLQDLRALNPALKRDATDPDGPHHLLIPTHAATRLRVALARIGDTLAARRQRIEYTVRSGNSLWVIAKQFGVAYQHLTGWNDLRLDGVLRPGRKLIVWKI